MTVTEASQKSSQNLSISFVTVHTISREREFGCSGPRIKMTQASSLFFTIQNHKNAIKAQDCSHVKLYPNTSAYSKISVSNASTVRGNLCVRNSTNGKGIQRGLPWVIGLSSWCLHPSRVKAQVQNGKSWTNYNGRKKINCGRGSLVQILCLKATNVHKENLFRHLCSMSSEA